MAEACEEGFEKAQQQQRSWLPIVELPRYVTDEEIVQVREHMASTGWHELGYLNGRIEFIKIPDPGWSINSVVDDNDLERTRQAYLQAKHDYLVTPDITLEQREELKAKYETLKERYAKLKAEEDAQKASVAPSEPNWEEFFQTLRTNLALLNEQVSKALSGWSKNVAEIDEMVAKSPVKIPAAPVGPVAGVFCPFCGSGMRHVAGFVQCTTHGAFWVYRTKDSIKFVSTDPKFRTPLG